MTQSVVVSTILARAPTIVFMGDVVGDGRRLRFVAPHGAGMARAPSVGETWSIAGHIRRDPVHGPQVHVEDASLSRPSGQVLVAMLAGPRCRDIGKKTAEKIWANLGEDLFRALEQEDAAALVAALGGGERARRQAESILRGWRDLTVEIDVIAQFDRMGIPPRFAAKAIECYGNDAARMIEADPYRLAVIGGSWDEIDALALGLGVPRDDARRLSAAVEQIVHRSFAGFGDTFLPASALRHSLGKLVGPDWTAAAIEAAKGDLSIIAVPGGWQGHGPMAIEAYVATAINERLGMRTTALEADVEADGASLNEGQRQAIMMAEGAAFGTIVGGAGTGKTTVLKAIADRAARAGQAVEQMALSGRAALRLSEATGRPARTIASFLAEAARRQPSHGRPCLHIVDEASMVDVVQLYRILRVLGDGDRLLLVGDTGQLPPIGPGLTLHAIAEGSSVPRAELTEIVRQRAETGIPEAARAVRRGDVPDALASPEAATEGVGFVACDRHDIAATVTRLRDSLGGETQIIAAFKGGATSGGGTRQINAVLHRRAAGPDPREKFVVGEPVVWTRNAYDIGLMNGEMGVVTRREQDAIEIDFCGRRVLVASRQLGDVDLAYAVTIHKAQGSAFDTVIVPVAAHARLDRTLVYTALTRAKRKVLFVGEHEALRRAIVSEPSSSRRRSALAWHLAGAVEPLHTTTQLQGTLMSTPQQYTASKCL